MKISAKKITGALLLLIVCGIVLGLSVRGLSGNPRAEELNSSRWSFDGPLELSPERGRFALIYSVVENNSLIFTVSVARLALPDLAINGAGEYVSLFAPGVSFLAIPGYIIGKYFGASQVGAYMTVVLFALANVVLVSVIAQRLGARRYAAVLGGLVFLFATPAFAYGVDLYQHHITVFILLFAVWLLIAFRSIWSIAFVWFLCATSIVIDNPNLFLMFPVGVFALLRLCSFIGENKIVWWKNSLLSLLTFVGFVAPLMFFAWYNDAAYGDPFQLPGTLQSVSEIGLDGKSTTESTYEKGVLTSEQIASREAVKGEKTAVGFFKTRYLYNGFYIHVLSPDRGMVFFAPVILLGIAGFILLYRRNHKEASLILATIGANVLLYSMWGDPWGGWAFGSRYLIPTYALLAIGLGIALSEWRRTWWFVVLFLVLFVYSSGVNTLGALTTSANPPKIQVLALESQTAHEQKYTFIRNWEYLNQKYEKIGSKSFVYQTWLYGKLTPVQYFYLVFGLVLLLVVPVALLNMFDRSNPPRI